MTDQQLITEYPTVDDHAAADLDDESSGEFTCFDPTDDSSSIDRARNKQATIIPLDSGTYSVTFVDGDHEVELHRTPDGWRADCWYLDDDGNRIGRCRGWVHHDGPCAHLWAVRSHFASDRLSDDDARHSTDVERAIADGGHHHAEQGERR